MIHVWRSTLIICKKIKFVKFLLFIAKSSLLAKNVQKRKCANSDKLYIFEKALFHQIQISKNICKNLKTYMTKKNKNWSNSIFRHQCKNLRKIFCRNFAAAVGSSCTLQRRTASNSCFLVLQAFQRAIKC